MNAKKIILFSLLLAASFISCEQNDDSNVAPGKSTAQETVNVNPVIAELVKQGFSRESIVETPEFFLVQGDMMFSKDIKDYPAHSDEHRHAATNNLVSYLFTVITVSVDPSVNVANPDNWNTAISAAMTEWSGVTGCAIRFVNYYGSNPDIVIKSDNGLLPNNVIASAGFPSNGKAYSEVLINLDFNNNMNVSESTKKYNMVHELGHCIGFRHTNWDALGEGTAGVGANLIPNTPSQDPSSVMNGMTALNSWNNFSSYDRYAVKYLYPGFACNYRLEGPNGSCAFDVDGSPIWYNVYLVSTGAASSNTWSISGNSLEIIESYANHCKIRVKSNNTVWPATGIVTMESQDCTVTYSVSLGNCINYDYRD